MGIKICARNSRKASARLDLLRQELLAPILSENTRTEAITGRILVVDDNDSNRNLLSHQLRRQGHEVNTASSGRQSLEMIRESRPDLILLDLFMPDMNGFDVLQAMHADESLRAVLVIVITGLNDRDAAVKCIEAGAFDLLIKPVNPSLLGARVVACLERKAWHDKEQAYQQELEKSYKLIRKVFGRYLSDEVVKNILESDDGMQMGGGKQVVTIRWQPGTWMPRLAWRRFWGNSYYLSFWSWIFHLWFYDKKIARIIRPFSLGILNADLIAFPKDRSISIFFCHHDEGRQQHFNDWNIN